MNGLYDGEFAGFKIPTSDDYDRALREAVVAVDANVLLDLYRFRPQTSQDLIRIFTSFGDRLIVPHQALREFWRHRQRSKTSLAAATKAATEAVTGAERSLGNALSVWAKAVGVRSDELAAITGRVREFTGSLCAELETALEGSHPARADDPILAQLEALLDGRVTAPLDEDEWKTCVEEGHRRIEEEIPPGYKDADKQGGDLPEGGAGDYLVWYQATRHGQQEGLDLVLITRDEKEDWWWRHQSEFLGPRPELTLEYSESTGRRLFLMRPADVLARAGALHVAVHGDSTADAERVSETDDVPVEAWTASAVTALLDRLDTHAPVQAAALRLAASAKDGRITRQQVYELGDYADERMLRGFTRPLRRFTTALQEEGVIPAGVAPILVARYPDGVKASYFSVPPEVPALLGPVAEPG
ncbi:PIN-like domain-containing protein [Nocardia jiangsuensis]|uniref:PIN-like domain-containing protein n=1 Tax=Nocardia jiangsuensis TaxID=1691563 RepID=A0ABV8DYS5_9NOCA